MSRFTNITLQTLLARLSVPCSKRIAGAAESRHAFGMMWECGERDDGWCSAQATAGDRPMPENLSPFEQEMFETAPLPEEGWTLKPCTKHRDLFRDFPEEAK